MRGDTFSPNAGRPLSDEYAGAFADVGNFTVLNGAKGVNDARMQVEVVRLSSYQFLGALFVCRGGAVAPAAAPAVCPGLRTSARRSDDRVLRGVRGQLRRDRVDQRLVPNLIESVAWFG